MAGLNAKSTTAPKTIKNRFMMPNPREMPCNTVTNSVDRKLSTDSTITAAIPRWQQLLFKFGKEFSRF
jgi:hypothetical protein